MATTNFSGQVKTGKNAGDGNSTVGTLTATVQATVNTTTKIGRLPDNSDVIGVYAIVETGGGAGGTTIEVGSSGAAASLGSTRVSAVGLFNITGGTANKGFSGDVFAALPGASAAASALVGVTYVQK